MLQNTEQTKGGARMKSATKDSKEIKKAKQKLGKTIKKLRENKEFSLRELARAVDLSPSNMKYIEDGVNAPSPDKYLAIIRYLSPDSKKRDELDKLFGQEFMGTSYAVGLAEMLIKRQKADSFIHTALLIQGFFSFSTDTLKEDCFPDVKMRFLLENPPFGTPWSGEHAKQGQEDAVKKEHAKGMSGRWGAGLPSGGDSQLLFMQSAIAKMDDKVGRAAIISNGSPLFTGGTASGESQIRRWLLESDLIEAIVQLPTDLFYNTGITTYIWVLSKNKRAERKGKIAFSEILQSSIQLRCFLIR